MTPRALRLSLLLAAVPAAAAAQDPAARAGLDRLRDSLTDAVDSLALKRLEAATIEHAKRARDDALLHLRLGFIAYRLGELAGGGSAAKSHFEDAAGEFEWATELQPGWPYAWYGLGLAELALGEHSVIAIENLRQQLGKDYLSKAARAFARAVEADPAFAHATIELANTALAQRIRPRLDVALEAVRLAAASAAGRHPDVQLVRGRVEREVGEVDSALAGFQAYLAVGGDSGVGQLELARTLYFARRLREARDTYFAGARVAAAPAALGLYRGDVGWLATSDDLVAFDALGTPAARTEWLERFWERRDVAEARAPGERLAEHYRRWFYVKRNFRLVSRHRHYDITEVYRSDQVEFDDRGIIYLRHGPPDKRATYPSIANGLEPNETWLYQRRDGDLIFHFVARQDVQDYKLVESLADALSGGFGAALALQGQRGLDPVTGELFASRADLSPVYARLGNTLGSSNAAGSLARERTLGQQSIVLGTTSDSYRHRFPVSLDVIASDFVMGGDTTAPGQTLHLVFAIPAGRLTPEPDAAGVRYALRFRVVVADADERAVARLDTTRVFGAREPLRGGTYLVGRLAVAVPSGGFRYRFLVSSPDGAAGDLILRDSVEVGRLDGSRFAASDLVLGREGTGLSWTLADDTVLLNPLGHFPEGSAAELYYEIYGLARGTPYHTVVRLEREGGRSVLGGLFGRRRAPVLLEFDAVADGPVTRVHRALDLRDTPRGMYRLGVVITDPASGRTFTRSRRLQVVTRQ